jgi:hypothetical protein
MCSLLTWYQQTPQQSDASNNQLDKPCTTMNLDIYVDLGSQELGLTSQIKDQPIFSYNFNASEQKSKQAIHGNNSFRLICCI